MTQPITIDLYREAVARVAATQPVAPQPEYRWLQLARALEGQEGLGSTYLATAIEGSDGREMLKGIRWCIADELIAPEKRAGVLKKIAARVVPLEQALARPCSTCGGPALVVGEDWSDHKFDPDWYSRASTLCLQAPHLVEFATSTPYYCPVSE